MDQQVVTKPKIILTRKQHSEFVNITAHIKDPKDESDLLLEYAKNIESWGKKYKHLKALGLKNFTIALLEGYDVETPEDEIFQLVKHYQLEYDKSAIVGIRKVLAILDLHVPGVTDMQGGK